MDSIFLSVTDDMIYAFAAGVATAACLLLPFLLGGRKKSGAIAKPVTGLTGDEKKDFLVVFEALTSEVVAAIDPPDAAPRPARLCSSLHVRAALTAFYLIPHCRNSAPTTTHQ